MTNKQSAIIESLEDLNTLRKSYINFLSEQLSDNAMFLKVHGIITTEQDIKTGAEYRKQIEDIELSIATLKQGENKEPINSQTWMCPRCYKIHSYLSTTCDCPPFTITASTYIPVEQSGEEIKEEQTPDLDCGIYEDKESLPYPNPVSKHQTDINIGWIRAMKYMKAHEAK